MKTNVEFTFALMPMDVRSGFALRRKDEEALQASADGLLKSLSEALQLSTRQAIDFGTNAPDVRSPEYVMALNNHASNLNTAVAADTAVILLGLLGQAAALNSALPGALGTDPDSGCEVRFGFVDSSQCVPCGANCHTVDGQADVVCRKGAAPSPLLWKARSQAGDTLTYVVRVNYRFLASGGA